MSNQTRISLVIVNFVALVAIARLDEAFFEFSQCNLKDRLKKQSFILPLDTEYDHITPKNQCCTNFLLHLVTWWFDILYFYMFPYFIFLFVYLQWKYNPKEKEV
jgi:hypothetical protein